MAQKPYFVLIFPSESTTMVSTTLPDAKTHQEKESPFYDFATVDSVSVYPVPRAELVSSAGADTDTGIDS